jgi:hypothetical protein
MFNWSKQARPLRGTSTQQTVGAISGDPNAKANILGGSVVHVDTQDCTVDVVTNLGAQYTIPWACLYGNEVNGEGIYAVPEPGTKGYVIVPSDGSQKIFLAFLYPQHITESFRNGRPLDLQPGDMMMIGRDGNGVLIKRGGVTKIRATEMCQRIFIPINNVIKDFCESYQMYSAGGTLTWHVSKNTGDDNATIWELRSKRKATEAPSIRLAIGAIDLLDKTAGSGPIEDNGVPIGNDQINCLLTVRDVTKTGVTSTGHPVYTEADIRFHLRIDKAGNVEFKGKGCYQGWEKFVLTCPSIYLGSSKAREEGVLGSTLKELLGELIDTFAQEPNISMTGNLGAPVPINPSIVTKLNTTKAKLGTMLSKKVKLE